MTEKLTDTHGAVIRGPRDAKRLSLVFTGGDFGEGMHTILDTLAEHGVKGSFYLTGGFLRDFANRAAIERAATEGHVLGPHSDRHLLYCPWDDRAKTLVSQDVFTKDLEANTRSLADFGVPPDAMRWWIPPYEWYNEDIARWSEEAGHRLFCFTPGTLSHTDYTEDSARNHRSNDTIWDSIIEFEKHELDGLNGFLLLVHVGTGPGRSEKFFNRLSDLITHLEECGYGFMSVPELLGE